ncbi:cupin domain-containing protein [Salarchaeum sp. JOR-1]|uniref:cupin domain-containing protein n=1 Tax=Salarchaeum sp. JOR-1 TaxID=2599399 RepID=UPI001198BB59|nr:cupin domain-containing protein [Salarchaeum sp. JOR-1]QDX40306.1 cupin domain-containing protein [Salarchaeum sp. JOR-1]
MEYHVVDPADISPTPDRPSDHHAVSDALGLERMALNVYRAEPGDQLPLAYHVHDEQEEAFYVLDGTLHVETPDGEHVVDTGELFVAEPESPHRAFVPADADTTVRALAVGAPAVDDVHPYEE